MLSSGTIEVTIIFIIYIDNKLISNMVFHYEYIDRSIRTSNKIFQSKVMSVPGGIELLLAAGYQHHHQLPVQSQLDSQEIRTSTGLGSPPNVNPCSSLSTVQTVPSTTPVVDTGNNYEIQQGVSEYLVHDMSTITEQRLIYTLTR